MGSDIPIPDPDPLPEEPTSPDPLPLTDASIPEPVVSLTVVEDVTVSDIPDSPDPLLDSIPDPDNEPLSESDTANSNSQVKSQVISQ